MGKLILGWIILIIPFSVTAQDSFEINRSYSSPAYNYSIAVPKTFEQAEPSKGGNIDLLFKDKFGASISINVTDRRPDEYNITTHDYTVNFLEKGIRQFSPNFEITESKKIMVDGEKGFLFEAVGSHPNLKVMECHIFHKDKAYVLSAYAPMDKFQRYERLFKNVISSLDYK